jgi:hypothetical protein
MAAVASPLAANRDAPGPQPRQISWAAALCIGIYAVLALAAYWPTWPGDPNRFVDCPCGDPSEAAWFLAWTPHALLHGINPFFTTAINHPAGINLAVNTEMPLLGLITAPLTIVFGPVSSLSLLMWLAYPISASAMLFALKRWTSWYPAAFAGGLLYGFSPYVVGQGRLHLQLVFVPLPPLIALAVYELLVRRKGSPLRWGASLGILVSAQFFISTEILASTFIVVVVGLAVLGASHLRDIPFSVRTALPGIAMAAVIVGVFVAYPAWMLLLGPQRYHVPVWVLNSVSGRSGPLGALFPTTSMWFSPGGLSQLGSATPGFGDIVENGSYLSIPLLLLMIYLVVRFWRNRWLQFMTVMAGVSFVLTLGPHLDLGNDRTSIALPFVFIERLPLVGLINPIRMSLFVAMFVSLGLALGLDEFHSTWAPDAESPAGGDRVRSRYRTVPAGLPLVMLLAVASVLLLVPRWPVATAATEIPPYFTSPAVDGIRPGSTVLSYPYPLPGSAQAMLWQAVAGMRFELLGSYALNPAEHGYASQFPQYLQPRDVQRLFYGEQGAVPKTGAPFPLMANDAALVADVRDFLRDNGIDVVLVAQWGANSNVIADVVVSALGRPSARSGQVNAWYDVRQRISHVT